MGSALAISFALALMVCTLASAATIQPAFACSCSPRIPEKYYQSEVIFVGEILERGAADNEMYVTFNVSQSWKGVETGTVTVHIDSPGCSPPFIAGLEYIVYGYNNDFGARIKACSGTVSTENIEYASRDFGYLNAAYAQIELKPGHTSYTSPILQAIQILSVSVGISAAMFFILSRNCILRRYQ